MSARLGLSAAAMACVLLIATPALADDGDTTTTTSTTSTTTSTTTAPPSTTAPTTPPATEPSTTETSTSAPTTVGESSTTVAETSTTVATAPVLVGGAVALDSPAMSGPARAPGPVPTRGTATQIIEPPPNPVAEAFIPPADSGAGRRVVYSKSKQTLWVYDASNTIIKSHRVSGKQTPYDPAPGVYSVFSRSIRTYSINNPTITWGYMVRFAHGARGGNIGFHEIPYQYGRPVQSEAQLGQALSGGCVRQTTADAIWMWNWAGVGTTVVVTP